MVKAVDWMGGGKGFGDWTMTEMPMGTDIGGLEGTFKNGDSVVLSSNIAQIFRSAWRGKS